MMGNKRGMKALESITMVRNKTNQIVKNTVQNKEEKPMMMT